jgi:general secretion pathway protein J
MRTRAANGFTLLELLVALVVFGFLMVGLTQGVRFGLLAWQSQARTTDASSEFDAVDRRLRQLIEQMDPGTEMDPPTLTAGPASLSFVTRLPVAAGPQTTPTVEAALLLDAGNNLVLRWTPHQHVTQLGPPPAPSQAEILPGVARLEFAYWRQGAGWSSAWRPPELPALVRIRLVFGENDRRHWPDIVSAPMRDRP